MMRLTAKYSGGGSKRRTVVARLDSLSKLNYWNVNKILNTESQKTGQVEWLVQFLFVWLLSQIQLQTVNSLFLRLTNTFSLNFEENYPWSLKSANLNMWYSIIKKVMKGCCDTLIVTWQQLSCCLSWSRKWSWVQVSNSENNSL